MFIKTNIYMGIGVHVKYSVGLERWQVLSKIEFSATVLGGIVCTSGFFCIFRNNIIWTITSSKLYYNVLGACSLAQFLLSQVPYFCGWVGQASMLAAWEGLPSNEQSLTPTCPWRPPASLRMPFLFLPIVKESLIW